MYKKPKFFKSSLLRKLAFYILHNLALLHHITFACLIAEMAQSQAMARKRKSFQGTALNDQLKNQDFLRDTFNNKEKLKKTIS